MAHQFLSYIPLQRLAESCAFATCRFLADGTSSLQGFGRMSHPSRQNEPGEQASYRLLTTLMLKIRHHAYQCPPPSMLQRLHGLTALPHGPNETICNTATSWEPEPELTTAYQGRPVCLVGGMEGSVQPARMNTCTVVLGRIIQGTGLEEHSMLIPHGNMHMDDTWNSRAAGRAWPSSCQWTHLRPPAHCIKPILRSHSVVNLHISAVFIPGHQRCLCPTQCAGEAHGPAVSNSLSL